MERAYEKYASFFWSLDCKSQSQQLTLQTRIRSNLQDSTRLAVEAGLPSRGGHHRYMFTSPVEGVRVYVQ